MDAKVALPFTEIAARIKAAAVSLPPLDLVVGIARGGVVPAGLLAYELGLPLQTLAINYRDDDNQPRHDSPVLLAGLRLDAGTLRILLVDDVSVSGGTLERAKAALPGHSITTLVMKGRADIVLFPEVTRCVNWPWHPLPAADPQPADR